VRKTSVIFVGFALSIAMGTACAGNSGPAFETPVGITHRNEAAREDAGNLADGSDADAADGSDADAADSSDADADADVDAADSSDANANANAEGPCPAAMALVSNSAGPAFCIDRYEGSLVEVLGDGSEKPFPHWLSPDEHTVKAVSQASVPPQGYISAVSAAEACQASGKRLCALKEWKRACTGAKQATYPYGTTRQVGLCNDNGRSPVGVVFPNATTTTSHVHATSKVSSANAKPEKPEKAAKGKKSKKGKKSSVKIVNGKAVKRPSKGTPPKGTDLTVWTKLNDPELGKVSGSWTLTGERAQCRSEEGVYDLVGNRHEWVSDETTTGNGIFAGGYFLDTTQNGEGCNYRTEAHAPSYHDYSTGFRCCSDATNVAPVR
jgi:formylglycine-generating enzyme